jgi:integral membrane protein (TIGR01906 family)
MPAMTVSEPTTPVEDAPAKPGAAQRSFVFVGTILVIIMLAVLPLLTPWFIHAALDASAAATRLGVEQAQTYALSDRSVEELLLASGDFAFAGPDGQPFYDDSERSHLRDARVVLWLLLVVGGLSLIGIGAIYGRSTSTGRQAVWRSVSRAGLTTAITIIVLGVVSLVAFGTVFTVFHQIFFPAGNYSFDPATQHLVQLYPFRFWQIAAAALAVLVFLLATAAWLVGRRGARRMQEEDGR